MADLVKYDAMCSAIAEAYAVDEVANIRDRMLAVESAARIAKNYEVERKAIEIRLRAERRAGQLLAEMDKSKGAAGNPGGRGAKIVLSHGTTAQTLSEIGITRDQSSKWQKVAALSDESFEANLAAVEAPSTSSLLRAAAKAERKQEVAEAAAYAGSRTVDLMAFARAGKKFGTIYADPPWLYDNQGTRAATSNHYGGMTVAELCELPVRELVADDAHLHLWTTNAFLFECPKIFEAWGFEFRSSFVWCKTQMGIGNYWRNSHEILLTAIRGDAKRFNDKSLKSWIESDRGRHSAKPEIVREMIEKASPGPYLEMFARSPVNGWDVWGNEVESGFDLLNHAIPEFAE